MKAINLPFYKRKLRDVSQELFLEQCWQMPGGLIDPSQRNPHNFTLAQWQQAKRTKQDPREIGRVFKQCWAASDSSPSFGTELKEHGYWLAKGDRQAFVALNHRCEVFSIPKWAGIKTKDVRARLGNEDNLLSTTEVRKQIANNMTAQLTKLQEQQEKAVQERTQLINTQLRQLASKHKKARQELKDTHTKRLQQETKQRQARFRKGLRGILDRVTGKHRKITQQNELEAKQTIKRDQQEKDQLIFKQADQRQIQQKRLERLHEFRQASNQKLSHDIKQYQEISGQKRELFELRKHQRLQQLKQNPTLEH